MTGHCAEARSRTFKVPEVRELWSGNYPQILHNFVFFHATANQKFRHFSMRRQAAKTAEHSLRVYYHPPESSPHFVTHLLLHNKLQYILSAPSCDQSKHPSPSSPDRGSSFVPAESNINDTLSTGIRPRYNKEFGVRCVVRTEECEATREERKEATSPETSET
jgi:hypothetical protein